MSMRDDERVISGSLGKITYEVCPRSYHIRVEYRGLPADLVSIGAVESFMAEKPKNRYIAQYDSNGDRYQRRTFRSGKLLLIRRFISTRAHARKLPGVPPDISTEIIDWLDQHPGEVYTSSVPTINGDHAWIHHCGTPAALDAGGCITNYGGAMLDGYQWYAKCDPIKTSLSEWPFKSFSREDYETLTDYQKAIIGAEFKRVVEKATKNRLRCTRPSYLRLVVNNQSSNEVSHGR
jgi:hypothetical protein